MEILLGQIQVLVSLTGHRKSLFGGYVNLERQVRTVFGSPLTDPMLVAFRRSGCIALRAVAELVRRTLREISDQIQGKLRRTAKTAAASRFVKAVHFVELRAE